IRQIDQPRPAQRLRTVSEVDRTSVAQRRSTEVAKISRLLGGDLDEIAMRCLEKDRARRYDTAAALAADLGNYLNAEPVSARPPSASDRLYKFIRRHKMGFAAGTAVAFSLIAGLATSTVLLVRERAAHERAVAAESKEVAL